MNEEELFGHAGKDWQPAHLLTDAEKAEDERMEAAKRKAKQ